MCVIITLTFHWTWLCCNTTCNYFSQALLGAISWGFVFSFVSAFSPNYYTLLLFRGLAGFGFGGGSLGWVHHACTCVYVCTYVHSYVCTCLTSLHCYFRPTYCIEFLPAKSRVVIFCLLEVSSDQCLYYSCMYWILLVVMLLMYEYN